MKASDIIVQQLEQSAQMLQQTIADLSDADLMTRPVNGANHPIWQLGHLCAAETNMLKKFNPATPELPAGFADRFNAKTESYKVDDQSKLANKKELSDLFGKIRAGTIAYAKTLSNDDLAKETGVPFAPTLGTLLMVQAGHVSMHVGQMQVLRRKLGKPILF